MLCQMKKAKIKLIYNPIAGTKRSLVPLAQTHSLEDILELFEQYDLPVDPFPTKSPAHAIELAKKSEKEGYEIVVAAGGDGTVATVAHGLVGSKVKLAVLPMGTVMNIARMLAVPNNLEMAVAIIKLGRHAKIDLGEITLLNGKKPKNPSYFVEQAGVGFDADYRYYLNLTLEKKDWLAFLNLIKLVLPVLGPRIKVSIDGKIVAEKARMVFVSNGPYSGPALQYSPTAKLNDHVLTTSVFTVSKLGLAKFLVNLFRKKKTKTSKVEIFKSKIVSIDSRDKKLFHADARVFGKTPIEVKITQSALNVIIGFPKPGTSSFKTKTEIDL
jgi:diacylglycerol kinase (ATP)